MDPTSLMALAIYAFVMSITPGPNNMMLTASGANYGFRRTMPHLLGIIGGCFVLFASLALGLGVVFERFPLVQTLLSLAPLLHTLCKRCARTTASCSSRLP